MVCVGAVLYGTTPLFGCVKERKMDKDHLFMLSYVIILGDLFFFTVEGIKKDDKIIQNVLADLYKDINFN